MNKENLTISKFKRQILRNLMLIIMTFSWFYTAYIIVVNISNGTFIDYFSEDMEFTFAIYLWFFLLIYIVPYIINRTHIITITKNKIIFKNYYTRKRKIYYLRDLDGMREMHQDANLTTEIIKDSKVVKIIHASYYKNYNDLVLQIRLKYLGKTTTKTLI